LIFWKPACGKNLTGQQYWKCTCRDPWYYPHRKNIPLLSKDNNKDIVGRMTTLPDSSLCPVCFHSMPQEWSVMRPLYNTLTVSQSVSYGFSWRFPLTRSIKEFCQYAQQIRAFLNHRTLCKDCELTVKNDIGTYTSL
jgi:hypothetical protein